MGAVTLLLLDWGYGALHVKHPEFLIQQLYLDTWYSAQSFAAMHLCFIPSLACLAVGTPAWMSPECIKGQPYDFSSDIWSLGCVLYELVSLRNPFMKENQSLYALGKSITSCTYDPLPEQVPSVLRELVTAMLQPSPQARPTIGQIVNILQTAYGVPAQG